MPAHKKRKLWIYLHLFSAPVKMPRPAKVCISLSRRPSTVCLFLTNLDVDEFFLSLAPLHETVFAKVTKTKPSRKKARVTASAATQRVPIFNCSCGAFGCGGYYVEVTRTREALIWEGPFVHSSQEAGRTMMRFAFSWDNVQGVASELIAAIASATRQYPDGEVGSGVMSVNLVERLPFYRERYEALKSVALVQ